MKFKSFLTEDLSSEVEQAVADVIKLKLIKPEREGRLEQSLALLVKGLKAGQIYNADFGDAKSGLGYQMERAWEANTGQTKMPDGHPGAHRWVADTMGHDFYYTQYSFHTSGKLQRHFKAFDQSKADTPELKLMVKNMEVLINAAVAVQKALQSLKGNVIKGRKPSDKPVDPNAFHRVLGNAEAQKLVKDALEAGIKKPLDEFQKQIDDWLQTMVDQVKEAEKITRKELRHDPMLNDIMFRCFEFKTAPDRESYSDFKINDRGKHYAADEAKKMRENIELRFLGKNIKKLSKVVELKGNLEKIEQHPAKPIHVRGGEGTVESTFTFKFADKSHFTVLNKIVSKYSNRGTHFNQLPTTFHDVTLPDGSKLKMPSEEKMVREFAVKKA